jgi:hypothetical protein
VGLFIIAAAVLVPAAPRAEDADMPEFARDLVDKETYHRMREANINLLRGLPYETPYNPRLKAVDEMKAQVARLGPFALGTGWTAIGPAPIPNGQTVGFTTAVSGRTTAIAIHPTNPDIVYVGTAQGGLYRSLDGGASWIPIFDSAQSLAIGALALAPSDPTILYVGTGEANSSADSFFGVGLYRIDDADTAPILTGPIDPLVATGLAGTTAFTGRAISRILVHPTDPATIFVSTFSGIGGLGAETLSGTIPPLGLRGIYRSNDATSASPTFQRLTVSSAGSVPPDVTGNRSISDMVLEPGDPNVLVCWMPGQAAGEGGIWRSTNALAANPTFTQTFVTTIIGARGELATVKIGSDLTTIVATGETAVGTGCTVGSGALRRSTDGGATWSAKLAGGGGFCGGQCFYDIAIAIHPTNANTILLGGAASGTCSRAYKRSTDGGATFANTDAGLHVDTHALAIAESNPNIVFNGNDGGIYKSTDGGVNWVSLNNTQFSATQFQSLAVHPTDGAFSIGGTQDNGTPMRRSDATWIRADFGDGGFAQIDQNATDVTNVRMYHTYFNQTNAMGYARVLTTASATDNGWTFHGCGFGGSIPNGMTCDATSILFYAPMEIGPGTPLNTLYFGSDVLYRSADGGSTMALVSQKPIQSGVAVSAIGVGQSDDNVRLVGMRNGKIWGTTTGSTTLTDLTNAGMPARFVGRVVVDPVNSNTAYATFTGFGVPAGQHVWKTTNLAGGAGTWVASGNGIPDVPVNAFVVDPLMTDHLYAGTDIGVYRSIDGGANWFPYNVGLPVVAVFDLAIQPSSRILRAATHGRGMWEIDIAPSPTSVATVAAEFVDGEVRVTWHASAPISRARVDRRPIPGDWVPMTDLRPSGSGTLSYHDRDVQPGRRYEYRLAIGDGAAETFTGHVWFDVPGGEPLALRSVWPNPARSALTVSLALASSSAARLELVDVTGRRVHTRDVSALGAGRHEVRLDVGRLKPGAYWVHLEQAGRVISRRTNIVR